VIGGLVGLVGGDMGLALAGGGAVQDVPSPDHPLGQVHV